MLFRGPGPAARRAHRVRRRRRASRHRRPRRTAPRSTPRRRNRRSSDLVHAVTLRVAGRRRRHGGRARPKDLLGSIYDNADALHVGDFSLRYVDEAAPLDQQRPGRARPGRLARHRPADLPLRRVRHRTGPARDRGHLRADRQRTSRIASFGGPGRTHAAVAGRAAQRRTHAADAARGRRHRRPGATRRWWPRAVRQVSRVLPDWKGRPAGRGAHVGGRAQRGPEGAAGRVRQHRGRHHDRRRLARARSAGARVREPATCSTTSSSAAPRW